MSPSTRSERSKLIRFFAGCMTRVIYSNPDFACIIVGCPQTAKLADLALQGLGFEPRVYTGKVKMAAGGKVDHVWVELPEHDLIIETNPQQVLGYPMPVLAIPAGEHKREHYLTEEEIDPDTFPATASTPQGQKFFEKLAKEVVSCFKEKLK
jgi:hypothetical protein